MYQQAMKTLKSENQTLPLEFSFLEVRSYVEYDVYDPGRLAYITVSLYDDDSYCGHVHADNIFNIVTDDKKSGKWKTLVVSEASLNKHYRNKGLGKFMYEEVLKKAYELGYAIAPEKSLGSGNGHTSTKANRVWKSLRKKYINVGQGVIGVLK